MTEWKDCVKLIDNIEDYEKEFKQKLPDDLKKAISENNMGSPFPNTFKLPNGEKNILKSMLSFNKKDKMNAYFCKKLEQIPKEVFPFAIDPFGNFICLKNSQIVFFDSEQEKCEYLCASFSELLENLTT